MKILSVECIGSYATSDQYPRERLPEVAFVGRSNVGKSSLINSLLNRKGMARISATPGKTQTLNFFKVVVGDRAVNQLFFVDLPGYGYAKTSRSVRERWGPMIEAYLSGRKQLCGVIQLVDSRGVERHDVTTRRWLRHVGHVPIVVSTKIDKLTRGRRRSTLMAVCHDLELDSLDDVMAYSATTHEGRQELWRELRDRCVRWQHERAGAYKRISM